METVERTKTKVMKKEVNLEQSILDYLKSSSKHYFQTKYVWNTKYKEDYYKVFPATFDDKLHYVAVTIIEGKVDVKITDTSWVKTKNHLGMIKNSIFPQNVNHKSMKPNLEMKLKMEIVKKFIDSSTDVDALKSEIKRILQ